MFGTGFLNVMGRAHRLRASPSFPGQPNTSTGTNVGVLLPQGIAINYTSVSSPGQTTAGPSPTNVVTPPGYRSYPGSPVFDLMTTAAHSGPITVIVNYPLDGLTSSQEQSVRLFHQLEGGSFEDITTSVDTNARSVTGIANTFSVFALGIQDNVPPAAITDLAVTATSSLIISTTESGS